MAPLPFSSTIPGDTQILGELNRAGLNADDVAALMGNSYLAGFRALAISIDAIWQDQPIAP